LSAEKYPQAMVDLAAMFNAQKRFSDAEPLLRKAIAVDASSWRGQFELAVALSGQQRFKEAVTCASAARDLKPETPQIYLLLYNLHIRTNDFPAALSDTQSYLKLTPDGATADRVRRMQEQVQKAVQSSGGNPGPSSQTAPVAGPAETPIEAAAPAPATISNFTPVDGLAVEPASASGVAPAAPAAAAPPVPEPATVPAAASAVTTPPAATAAATAEASAVSERQPASPPDPNSVIPMRVDEFVPQVAVDVPCSLPTVLHGAGQRAEQLLSTLQKFDASERVEHYKLNAA
jgi:tetratricopeptide (TPR) repeat protein